MFTVGESPPNILGKEKRTADSTTVDSTSGWKSSLGKNYKQNSARPRTSTLNSGRATAQRRQTLSTIKKRQQENTTITLQTKPTDCRCFSKMRSIEFATNRRGIIERQVYTQSYPFFDATIGLGSKNYIICKIDMRSMFPTD